MRVDKREFTWEFHQLSCPGQTRTRVAWELTSESLHESFINSRVLVKREQELHESWQARVYMRVSSTLVSWSNENKSCMRVDKREFTWEFHQLSCPGQTRTRVAWELTSESLHESFINSRVLVKREQELHESWQARVSSNCLTLVILKDAYPARLKKILIISAPLWFTVSFKIISTFLSEKIRDRVEFAECEDIKEHLEEECIPKDLGGMWDVNHKLWMTRCIESYQEGNYDEPCFQRSGSQEKPPKQPSPKRVPDINVLPEEPPRNLSPRNGVPDGLTVQQLLAHMREKGPRGIKREFESLMKFDRQASYHVFK